MIEALIDVTLPQAANHDNGFYPAAVRRYPMRWPEWKLAYWNWVDDA